ncbi:MAG TPA: hypothetical protein PLA97_11805 [Rubrivivax sp.]|nr:hypothetical protein [Rubrivivax sp.]
MNASAAMPRRRRIGQASSLMQTLRWATRRILLWLAPAADVARVESRRRDIAQVRSLAAQVRRSQPGYANDLEAAASALEAQQPAW